LGFSRVFGFYRGQKNGQKMVKKWSINLMNVNNLKKGDVLGFSRVFGFYRGQKVVKKWSKNGQKNGQ
jgi:hypothetical protein